MTIFNCRPDTNTHGHTKPAGATLATLAAGAAGATLATNALRDSSIHDIDRRDIKRNYYAAPGATCATASTLTALASNTTNIPCR